MQYLKNPTNHDGNSARSYVKIEVKESHMSEDKFNQETSKIPEHYIEAMCQKYFLDINQMLESLRNNLKYQYNNDKDVKNNEI